MKRDYRILLMISFSLLTYSSSYAGLTGEYTGDSNQSTDHGSTGSSTVSSQSSSPVSSFSEGCETSQDSQTVSPDFLVDQLGFNKKAHFESSRNNLIDLSFPRLLNVDLCFKPKVRIDKLKNNKIIRFENDENLKLEDILLDTTSENYKMSKYMIKQMSNTRYRGKAKHGSQEYKNWLLKLSEEDKVLRCIAIKYPEYFEKIPGKKGKFRANQKKMSSNSSRWPEGSMRLDTSGTEIDVSESSRYFFGSPMGSRGNNKVHKKIQGNNFYKLASNDESCFDVVKINDNKNYANMTTEDSAYYKMEKGCNGQDPLMYMKGLADLHVSYTGNSKEVFSQFNDVLLNIIGENHENLEKEADDLLAKIKEKANEILKLSDRKKKKGDDDDDYDNSEDEEIESVTKEYVALLNEYDTNITQNVGELLSGLEKKYKEDGISKKMKKNISEKMRDLRKVAGKLARDHEGFVKVHGKHMSGELIKKIKKIVSTSKGESILKAFYRSKQIGKVCKGRCNGSSLSMKQAKRNIEKRVVKFDVYDREDWLEHNAAYNGYDAPLKAKRSRIAREQKSIMSDLYSYKARETRDYNKVCGTQYNSMDCFFFKQEMEHNRKYFITDLQSRASYVKVMGNQYNDMQSLYSSGLRYNQQDRNTSDGGIDFSKYFNSVQGSNFAPNLQYSLHGQDPFSMSNGVQGLMQQQQLMNGVQPGTGPNYNPAQMQQSRFIQNGGGAANGLGNPLYGPRVR